MKSWLAGKEPKSEVNLQLELNGLASEINHAKAQCPQGLTGTHQVFQWLVDLVHFTSVKTQQVPSAGVAGHHAQRTAA